MKKDVVRVGDFGDWPVFEEDVFDPAKDKGVVLLRYVSVLVHRDGYS